MGILDGQTLVEFIRSARGRSALQYGSAAGGLLVFGAYWIPQYQMLDQSKEILQMYRDGYPVKLSAHVVDLAAEALTDCKMPEKRAKFIKWFTAFGFDPLHKGIVASKYGAIIGVPKTFFYKSPDDVDRSTIKIHRDRSVPWKSEAGEALMSSIILSDQAKKFALAREICSVNKSYTYAYAVPLSLVIPVASSAIAWINDRYNLFRYPLSVRMALYVPMWLVSLLVAILYFDFMQQYHEMRADSDVAKLGESYLEGGVEYYSKQLLTNRALRELLGDEGKSTYTRTGEVRHWIRQPHLTITSRRDFLEKKLNELRATAKDGINSGTSEAVVTAAPLTATVV